MTWLQTLWEHDWLKFWRRYYLKGLESGRLLRQLIKTDV